MTRQQVDRLKTIADDLEGWRYRVQSQQQPPNWYDLDLIIRRLQGMLKVAAPSE